MARSAFKIKSLKSALRDGPYEELKIVSLLYISNFSISNLRNYIYFVEVNLQWISAGAACKFNKAEARVALFAHSFARTSVLLLQI